MAEVVLERLRRSYGDGQVAVDDVSLRIADGELLVLVGPSGCGKSTLLRMIAGLEPIDAGELRIGGERMNERPPRERDVAMVFQSYALYPHLTVFENLAFPLRVRGEGAAAIRARVEQTAQLLGLTEHLQRRPAQLSGGQRQRVAMGRALVREPHAFLLDEPLSNLDGRLRAQMRAEIARLQRRLAVTTIHVTHDQTEAMTLGDRVAVLRGGRLQQVGTPRELYERPANLFVAGFIGSPPMNLLPARREGDHLQLPFARIPLPAGARAVRDPLWAGLRPEAFADASLLDPELRARGVVFDASVDVLEWLGSAQHAVIPLDVAGEQRGRLAELDRLQGSETLRPQLVAALDPSSAIRPGKAASLWLDPEQLHLFDGESGVRIALAGAAPHPGLTQSSLGRTRDPWNALE